MDTIFNRLTRGSRHALRGLAGVVATAMLLGAASAAQAADRYVDTFGGMDNGNNCAASTAPCQTIRHAIDQSAASDVIHVGGGTYVLPDGGKLLIDTSRDGLQLIGDPNDRPKIARFSGAINQPLLVINGASGVHVENFEFDMDQSFVAEGIVAGGFVNGLTIRNNLFVSSRTSVSANSKYSWRNAIAIGYGNNSQGLGSAAGATVQIDGNTINGVWAGSPGAVFLRAGIQLDGGNGSIANNTVTAGVQDIVVRFASAVTASDGTVVDINGNQTSGRGLEIDAPNASTTQITINNNVINAPAGITESGNYAADWSLVRLIHNGSNVATTLSNNTFSGHVGSFRGVLIENFPGVKLLQNIFTPAANASSFVSLVVSNKEITTDNPPSAPLAFALTAKGNVFNGSNVSGAGTAVELLNDNDAGGTATYGNLVFGGASASDPNQFDANLGWYFHLDDFNCDSVTAPACTFLDYAGAIGSNVGTNTEVRPFAGTVTASDNLFDSAKPADMTPAQQANLLAHTWDLDRNAALGVVNYGLAVSPAAVYVDDDYATASHNYGDALSFTNPSSGTITAYWQIDAFATITDAVQQVASGGTVYVAAGTYAESSAAGDNLVIAKPVTLLGAQAGVAALNRSDTGASIIVPAVASATLDPDSYDGIVVTIDASDVALNGFVVDGDNPNLTSAVTMQGANPDVARGVSAFDTNNTHVVYNVMRNLVYAGFEGGATNGTQGNVVQHNWIHNLDVPSTWGLGVVIYNNYYAVVSDNDIDGVRVGVQTNNFSKVAPVPGDALISNNRIHASWRGIFFNLTYGAASPFTISGNTLQATSGRGVTGEWKGLLVESLGGAQTATISSNSIDGSGAEADSRPSVGYVLNNVTSTAASSLALDGGTVSHVDIGVLSTDAGYYAGPVNDYVVQNVQFSDIGLAALYVEDTAEQTGSAKLTVGTGNSFASVAHKLAISGATPVVAGEALDDVLVRAGGSYFFQPWLFPAHAPCASGCTVANASINAGIGLVTTGGTVTVDPGTFAESVRVTKSLTLKGPYAGVVGFDASRGTGEAIIQPPAGSSGVTMATVYPNGGTLTNATLDGFTIQGVDAAQLAGVWGGQNHGGGDSDGISILNNRILDTANGSALYTNGPVGTVKNWTVSGNLVRNVTSAVGSGINLWKVEGGTITNNHVEDAGFGGIQTVDASDVLIQGNTITGTGAAGINVGDIGSGSNNVRVLGNTITNANTGSAANQGGLVLSGDNSNVVFMCNAVSGGGSNGFATAGSAAAYTSIRVFDNDLSVAANIEHDNTTALAIGSNWYGGTAVTTTGTGAANARVADALAATPIGSTICATADPATANNPTGIVAYSGGGQSAVINSPFTQSLAARVVDALGGAVAGQTVSFTAPTTGASASFGAVGATDWNGVASTTATANGTAGSYEVGATSGSFATAAGSGFALTNTKATGTVQWGTPTSFTYDGNQHAPTATIAEETGVVCAVTPVGPNVGTYTATATCTGSNYDATGSVQVAITKATATLSLSHLVQAYDGAPKSVLVTTSPANVGFTVSYVGTGSTSYGPSAVPPTAVGTYAVTASVNDGNYTGTDATGSLQIVTSNGDIALVVNGPVDPIHVGDAAQFAATMLANPALHQGQGFGYHVVLSKSNGDPLALSDIAGMEVFYQGSWVDVTTITGGTLPFTTDGNGDLVYDFPNGIPGYVGGFPIQDPSWTWNVRFTFATTGTYTTSWTLIDGGTLAPISPLVSGSTSVVVEPALPPTDIHLTMGGPAESVQANTPVEYTATMLADPSLHQGEMYAVHTTIAKSGGNHALQASDVAAMEVYYQGTWTPVPAGTFTLDPVSGELVWDFPGSFMPGGFPIQDPEWTWNYRITWADTGTYTLSASVIHASDVGNASAQVFANGAVSTSVIPQVIVPPAMSLALVGPVQDVAVGAPAEYTGTLIANPADFTGRTFWVRVRLSKNGGAEQMTPADISKMELYNSGWVDATSVIKPTLIPDGNDLLYFFPQPNAAFQIVDPQWTWHFRFTYADAAQYTAVADVIDASNPAPQTAPALASANLDTNVVPMPADLALNLQGPVSGTQVGDATAFNARLTNAGGALADNALVQFRISRAGGSVTTADIGIEYFDGTQYLPLPMATCGTELCGDFGPSSGFPVGAGYDATTPLRVTFATPDTFTVQADVVDVPGGTVLASDALTTVVVPHAIITAQVLVGAASLHAVYDGLSHAAAVSTDPTNLAVTVTYNGSATLPVDAGIYNVVATVTEPGYAGTANAVLVIDKAPSTVTIDSADLAQVYGLTFAVDASASPISTGGVVNVSYNGSATNPANAGSYTVVATLDDPNYQGSASATLVVMPATATFTLGDLSQIYDNTAKSVSVNATPTGTPYTVAYDGSVTPPTSAGSYSVVVTSADPNFAGTATGTLVIAKAPATFTLGDLNQTYDGTAKPVSVNATPTGTPYTVSYDGGTTVPTDAGSYSVVVTSADPNFAGTATGTLVIAPRAVTITLSDLVQIAGNTHAVTVQTTPNGVATTVTYDGATTVPTAVGNYTVVATTTDPNYRGTGSATLQVRTAAAPNLGIAVTSDHGFAQYDDLVTYTIKVNNTGNTDVVGANVNMVLPATVLPPNTPWTCMALGTATCGSNGGFGDLHDTVSIPAGGGVVYLVTVIPNDDQSLGNDQVWMQATVSNVPGDTNAADDQSTTFTQLVIFRNGFEEDSDGAEPRPAADGAVHADAAPGATTQILDIDREDLPQGQVLTLARVAGGATDAMAVQGIRIAGHLLVRLAGTADGQLAVTAWGAVPAGTSTLGVGLAQTADGSKLLLVGASKDLAVKLSNAATTLALSGVTPRHQQ